MALLLILLLALQGPQSGLTPVSIEEYLQLKKLAAVAVSADGDAVAFTVTAADLEEDGYRTVLYRWDSQRGPRAVAPRVAEARSPRWSRDGERLAFLGTAAGQDNAVRLWILPTSRDSAPIPVTNLNGQLLDFDWAPGGTIYALTHDQATNASEIWKVQTVGVSAERVWRGDPGLRELAVSPDGERIVYNSTPNGAEHDATSIDLFVLDLGTGTSTRLTTRPGPELSPVWSADGRSLAFRAPQDPDHPNSQIELFSMAAAGGAPTNLTASFDRSVIDHAWPADGDLLFSAAVGTQTHLFALNRDGSIMPVTSGTYDFGAFDAVKSGTVIFTVRQSASEPSELWRIDGNDSRRVTDFNAFTRNWKLGEQRVINWRSPDGLSVEGLLVYPANYEEGRSFPLLVNPNGGPARRVRNILDQPDGFQLLAAHGYTVLAVNPRGSRGYGESFARAKRTDLAGGDFVDVMAGIDYAIGLGVADPQRLAVYGEGYGAFLSSWAITQTQRFRAAIGVYAELDSGDALSSDLQSAFQRAGLNGNAWAILESERSPSGASGRSRTPLLIISAALPDGESTSRARELYRSLNSSHQTVEYLELPASGLRRLGPRAYSELFFRELRWFDKYLKFDGQDLFDFHLVGEWVAGPRGWEMQVARAELRAAYSGLLPESNRYLEVNMTFRPIADARRAGQVETLEFMPATAVTLIGPVGTALPFAGVVTEIFGRETLARDSVSVIRVAGPGAGAPAAVSLRLAFKIPPQAAEYRLLVSEFGPVRIWAGAPD